MEATANQSCGLRRVGALWYIVLWTEEGRCMVVHCVEGRCMVVHCVVDRGG